jgi:hypothetical protein
MVLCCDPVAIALTVAASAIGAIDPGLMPLPNSG